MTGLWVALDEAGSRITDRGAAEREMSGTLLRVYTLLTKRRAVDFCRLRSSLCRMR